ncbi:hypothetical protein BC628DRAFT_213455 [Trametes gibbosa]|nr:hypothetical protein BC628DRAFT_213455 [Trametes gibbosa]
MGSLARPPDGLFDIVKSALVNHQHDRQADQQEHPSTPPLAQPPAENNTNLINIHDQQSQDKRPWKDDEREGSSKDAPSIKPDVSVLFSTCAGGNFVQRMEGQCCNTKGASYRQR